MTNCVFNISELSNNHKMLELCGYELPRFLRSSEEKLSAVTAGNTSIMANNILWVTNPIKEPQGNMINCFRNGTQ